MLLVRRLGGTPTTPKGTSPESLVSKYSGSSDRSVTSPDSRGSSRHREGLGAFPPHREFSWSPPRSPQGPFGLWLGWGGSGCSSWTSSDGRLSRRFRRPPKAEAGLVQTRPSRPVKVRRRLTADSARPRVRRSSCLVQSLSESSSFSSRSTHVLWNRRQKKKKKKKKRPVSQDLFPEPVLVNQIPSTSFEESEESHRFISKILNSPKVLRAATDWKQRQKE